MARTYAVVGIDEDATPMGWKLVCSPSAAVELTRKLRPRGFFANHATLHELEKECVRLSKFPDTEKDASLQPSLCSKESSSDSKNLHSEQAVQSPLAGPVTDANTITAKPDQDTVKTLMTPSSPCMDLSKDSLVSNWHVGPEKEGTVPITEVPYLESSAHSPSARTSFVLSGVVGKEHEQLCVAIEEWKLDLTAQFSLAIHAKTTKQVWVQLGKPEQHYEQTIRSVLVYIQLFSMVVKDSELTRCMLFQYLHTKFNYWKVKPDVSDLYESLILMKRFNLGCLFPLERRVLSRVMAEAGDAGESDADNGGTRLTFKRPKLGRQSSTEPQVEVSGENTVKNNLSKRSHPSTSDSNEGLPALKRQTRSTKIGIAATRDLDHFELLSPSRSDNEHIILGSKLQALKTRKANPQINEDSSRADRLPGRKVESTKRCIAHDHEVESDNTERASTSSVSLEKDQGVGISHEPQKSEGKSEFDNAQSRIEKIMSKTQRGHTWGSEYEYHTEPFPTIRKLWDATLKVRDALNCMVKGGTLDKAQSICSVETLRNVSANEVVLREYGVSQFLPAVNRQKEVAERINYYAHDGDTVVEICSQTVDYLSLLKERLTNLGKLCNYKRFMMDRSQRQNIKEWINNEGLPTGSKLLVCLSLSFSLWGEQSKNILDCVLELKPKLIVLIAPLFSRKLDEQSTYNLIWADAELLQSEILWPWGLMEVPSTALDKKKGVSPTIFLWSRTDWATKHRQIASRFGHLKKSVPSSSKGHAD